MNVLVLHNAPEADANVDEHDVLMQRDAVVAALTRLGAEVATFGCTLNLDEVCQALSESPPDVVFNLVESLAGTDRLMSLVPILLEAMEVPYTGATSKAILATSNKATAKARMQAAGLPTPPWLGSEGEWENALTNLSHSWIIKPIWEHASVGMDDDAIVAPKFQSELVDELRRRQQRSGRPMFAEQFIDGREFNLSILGGEVLPPAEIDFLSFPVGKPRIVGHRAKWEQDSFEYQQTPRRFDFSDSDQPLLDSLRDLSQACWELFELTGFARVDFRVDRDGRPWILEVNVNPCLSPDAGFAAAVSQAGMSFDQAVKRIIEETSIHRPHLVVDIDP